MNISGYTRISVDIEQDRDNTSIENQKAIISDYVATYFPQAKLTLIAPDIPLSSARAINKCGPSCSPANHKS